MCNVSLWISIDSVASPDSSMLTFDMISDLRRGREKKGLAESTRRAMLREIRPPFLSLSLSLSVDNCANCVNCNAVNRRQIWVTWIDLSDTSLHVLTFNSSRSRQYGKASGQPNNFSSLATTSDNFTTAKRKVRRMQSRGVHARALNRDTRCKSCIELESYAGVLKHSADSNWVLSLRF